MISSNAADRYCRESCWTSICLLSSSSQIEAKLRRFLNVEDYLEFDLGERLTLKAMLPHPVQCMRGCRFDFHFWRYYLGKYNQGKLFENISQCENTRMNSKCKCASRKEHQGPLRPALLNLPDLMNFLAGLEPFFIV